MLGLDRVAVTFEAFFLLPFLVFAAVIAVAVYHWQQQNRRREALATWALTNGLAFAPSDNSLLALGFHLFSKGDGRGCDNVASGTWHDREVRVADYWYFERSSTKDRSKTYHRFSVVAMRIDAAVPSMRITRENPITWLADRIGLRDITFESEEFNRRFDVHASEREFAFKLLDARMMEWLLHKDDQHCYETNGSWVMCYSSRLAPTQVPTLLTATEGFVAQIPRLVWADYGKASP